MDGGTAVVDLQQLHHACVYQVRRGQRSPRRTPGYLALWAVAYYLDCPVL